MKKLKKIPISYSVIPIFMWILFAIYDYRFVKNQFDQQNNSNFSIIDSKVVANNLRYNEILNLMRTTFENYSPDIKYRKLILENLKYNNDLKLYDTNDFGKYGLAALTYAGAKITPKKLDEMERALSLTHLFQEVKRLLPRSPWIYYTSADFIYIYPFVNSKDYHFYPSTPEMPFYTSAKPENNPQRKMYFTDPYIDIAGAGLMATMSLPVYVKNEFYGSLSIDFTLTDLQRELTSSNYNVGEYQMVNNNGYLLTTSDTHAINAKVLVPIYGKDILKGESYKYTRIEKNSFLYFVYYSSLSNLYIIYKIKKITYYTKIISLMNLTLFFGLFLLMINIVLIVYNNFQKKLFVDDVQKNKLISLAEMSAGIAHEINNPLTVIRGKTEQLIRSINNNKIDQEVFIISLERIFNSSDRIAKIVKALKNFSREGQTDPFVDCKIKAVIDDTLILCENRIRNNDAQLTIPNIPDIALHCRPYQVVQVLINIINNSYDAIEGQNEKWIRILISSNDKSVSIRIVDSGLGIHKKIVEKMFDPFFTNKAINKGTGLGLSISRKIALDHSGDLFYELYEGHTSFVLFLPIAG